MTNRTQTLDFKLAKVMIAFAWVDGRLENAEINALKDIIFSIGELTGEEWAALDIYMDSPVGEDEREGLLADLLDRIGSRADKSKVLNALEKLVRADGLVSSDERTALDTLRDAVESRTTGLAGALARLIPAGLRGQQMRRRETVSREDELATFLRNRVLYDFQKDQAAQGMSDSTLRKVCAAAGLLGKVAVTDEEFSPEEKKALADILSTEWELPRTAATALADIAQRRAARGLDYACVARDFFEETTSEERKQFISCLFRLANAFGKTSYEEIEAIRGISLALKVPHSDFIEAKLTIPRTDRKGL